MHPPSAAPLDRPPRLSTLPAPSFLRSALQRIWQLLRPHQAGLIALLLSGWAGAAQADTQWLRQAQTLTETRPHAPATPPADWAAARSVALPDEWSDERAGPAGVVWYRLALNRPAAGAAAVAPVADTALYGLYIERACSVLQVWLNGHLVHDGGRFDEPVTRNCHRPQLVPVPAALLHRGANVVDLRIKGFPLAAVSSRQRAGGVSAVEFGPYDQMAARHARRLVFAIRLPEVMSGALVLMGSFMFVMGWFNRAQSHLAYFGALMVGWALLLARLWAADLPLPNGVTELALAGLMSFITLAAVQFLMRYAGHRVQGLNIALPVQCVLMPLSLLAAGPSRLYPAAGVWSVLLTAQVVTAAVYYLAEARRQHKPQFWSMAALLSALAVSLAVGFLAQMMPMDAHIGYIAELVPALGFLALGLRLVQQFGRAYQTVEQDRAELEVRIREATAQIERNFAQLSELKVEQVTERERKRIAADLHDDLGAKLLTIVHTSDSERISTLAREALEEMRLSVRGLTGKPVKLIDALGDWRAEVVSRLTQSGVQGEWHSPSDEEVPHTLSSRAYVQTTRILREAVSNILKHSGASQCSVRCTIAQGDFQLVIQDNGIIRANKPTASDTATADSNAASDQNSGLC